jgi:hypothetical protein
VADQTIDLQIRTLAELKGLNETLSGLKKVQSEAKGATQELTGAFGGLNKGLSGIPKALGGIAAGFLSIRAAGDFLKGSISEALQAEKVLNDLTVALEGTGEATSQVISDFQEYAKVIQQTTRFGDDAVLAQVALAKNFGLTNEEAKKLVTAATDLAAVTGNDLGASTEILLKTLSGQLPRSLKVLGREFGNLTEEQLKAGAAVDLFQSKFGNRAEKDITTLSGAVAQLSESFKNLQESVGIGITSATNVENINAFTLVIENLKDGVDLLFADKSKVEELSDEFEKLSKAIAFNEKGVNTGETLARLRAQRDAVIKELASIQKESQKLAQSAPTVEVVKVASVDEGAIQKLLDSIKSVGLTATEIAKRERDERLKALNAAFGGETKLNLLSVDDKKRYADAKLRIEKDLNKRVLEEQKKASKEQNDVALKALQSFNEAKNNPGNVLGKVLSGRATTEEEKRGALLGASTSIVQNPRSAIGIGAQGAGFAIGGEAGGQVGAAIAPVLQELSKGKEAARAFVTEFLNSIPDMILGLVDGISEAAVAFLDNIPIIIERFIAGIPQVIESLAAAMPRVALAFAIEMPLAAVTFATSLIEQAPAIAEAIVKSIGNAPGNAAKGIGRAFKFAEGGQGFVKSVPGGFGSGSSERFPAVLGSGELVVDRSTANRLKEFLGANTGDTQAASPQEGGGMMDAIMALANRPIVVTIDGREIAKAVRSQIRSGLVLA